MNFEYLNNPQQKEGLTENYNLAKKQQPLVKELKKILTSDKKFILPNEIKEIEKTYCVIWTFSDLNDTNLNRLISDWFFITQNTNDFIQVKWKQSNCHENSYLLVKNSPENLEVMTWFALSDDWLWREHSWIINEVWDIIETTVPRVAYYWYILNKYEMEQWEQWYG